MEDKQVFFTNFKVFKNDNIKINGRYLKDYG